MSKVDVATAVVSRSIDVSWRLQQTFLWVSLAVSGFFYLLSNSPFPRPLHLFLSGSVAIAIIFFRINTGDQLNPAEKVFIVGSMLFVSFYLRLTQWDRVVYSGSDMHSQFATRSAYVLLTGTTREESAMYALAPLNHISIAVKNLITDLWLFDVRLVVALTMVVVPLLFYLVANAIDGERTGLNAMLLAVAYPLLFRTGVFFDPESLALPLFIILIYFLYKTICSHGLRFVALLLGLSALTVWVHFLYPLVIVGTLFGTVFLLPLLFWLNDPFTSGYHRTSSPLVGLFAIFSFVFTRILFTRSGGARMAGAGVAGFNYITAATVLVPTGGATAETSGTTGPGGIFPNLLPIALVMVAAIGGGIYALYYREREHLILISLGLTLGVGTLIGILGYAHSTSFRLGYRLYYFLGLVSIIFAALAITKLATLLDDHIISKIGTLAIGSLTFVVLVYAALGPIVPVGNTNDPYGGGSNAVTLTDYEQLMAMETAINPEFGKIRVSNIKLSGGSGAANIPDINKPSSVTYPTLTHASETCSGHSPWASGQYRICYK